ncbi:MAG: vWA domain-containing protein [Eubacteriales bacterium]
MLIIKKLISISLIILLLFITLSGCVSDESKDTSDVEAETGDYEHFDEPAKSLDSSSSEHLSEPSDISDESELKMEFSSDADVTSESPDIEVIPPEQEREQVQIEPGQLTAGEWRDLDNWQFWLDLMQNQELDTAVKLWKFNTQNKIETLVTNGNDPVVDAEVVLTDKQNNTIWATKTDNRGRAYLFSSLYNQSQNTSFNIKVVSGDAKKVIEDVKLSNKTIDITIENSEKPNELLDLMFVVDTTGSMGDELEYLKEELKSVVNRTKDDSNQNLDIRISCNYYRDHGDEYVTRSYPFTKNIKEVITQISNQSADGGGDYEEAVETALKDAIENHQWSENAKARLLFLVLDAPPHPTDENIETLHNVIKEAAEKGIHIIPIASSGVDKSTEFLLRFFSISTNGTYVFLTDDSGIGNSHIEPTIGEYDVELLNDLLVRVINKYVK